ncbi:MAG: hypothetical protein WD226_03075 [Planctomycetota bacterium]
MIHLATPLYELPDADWFAIGLVLSIVGGFLLANSIVFRHPRRLVEEHFGGGPRKLQPIREYVFHRVQVHLGFWILLGGFALQLYGHLRPVETPQPDGLLHLSVIGGILVGVVALEIAGWWCSHRMFRRYVREYFLIHPPDLESEVKLARELAELYGIAATGEDTVEAFSARLRREMGLVDLARVSAPRPARLDELSPVEEAEEELV